MIKTILQIEYLKWASEMIKRKMAPPQLKLT